MAHLGLDADSWAQLSGLLDSALDLPASERDAWLVTLEARHEPLVPQLRELLARAIELEDSAFLSTLPALDLVPEAFPARDGADTRVGPYRLVRELGRGGMGTVWLAERADGLFKRPVALKFPQGIWDRELLRERMARERQLLATLDHPGIARLYDAGLTDAGVPYLALEYVDGVPLNDYCRSNGLDIRERLGLFVQIADAVAYAHTRLIIHRDLKPSNILVNADGQVRLLDFGIAKLLGGEELATDVTAVAGSAFTPDYASPEQIDGRPLTVATDVYSLGVVLYELVTGQRPYQLKRDSRGALEEAIIEADPRRPSQAVAPGALQRALRGDLDAVILEALKKDPEERYATVALLADDVRRHLAGHPVSARPDRAGYRVRRFLARHKLATAAVAGAVVAVLTGAGTAVWQAQVAREQAALAEAVSRFVTSIFQGVDPQLLGGNRPLTATEVLDQAQQRVAAELAGQPVLQQQLRAVIARSYLGLHELTRARDLLSAMLAEAEAAEVPDPEVVRPLHLLMAQAQLDLAEMDEAERHLDAALQETHPGHPDEVTASVLRSGIAYQRGLYDVAAEVGEQAVALAEAMPGLAPEVLADVHSAVGKAAGMQRRIAQSLEHNRRAYELAMRASGGDHHHPDVLEHEHNYAASLIDAARIDEALPHLERSLEAARTTYGETSLVAGQYGVRLGLVLMERGQLIPAIELIRRGLEIEAAFQTGPSPSMAGRRRTLARVLFAARRLDEAAHEIDRAVAAMQGFDNQEVMLVLEADQAFLHAAASGARVPGIARLRDIVSAQDRGDPRYKTHLPDIYLGVLHLWQGDVREAVSRLERGVELARRQTRTSELGEALTYLGTARLAGADLGAAESALREGEGLLRRTHLDHTPALAEAWLGLGRVALAKGDHAGALELLQRAHGFWEDFSPGSPGAGEAALWLARARSAASLPEHPGAGLDPGAR